MKTKGLNARLIEAGLKITPQRVAVLVALTQLDNHPTAEQVIGFIQSSYPNIAPGTVYKTLETFAGKGIIRKVKTDRDIMRYDAITEPHHHLYSSSSDRIEDFTDPELQAILEDYFLKHRIPGFRIEDIKVQVIGEFISGTPRKKKLTNSINHSS
jgi:Fur family peroxide stress response transcriptional regulator